MVSFLIGAIFGTVLTTVMVLLFAINVDDSSNELQNQNELTVEDCSKLKAHGYHVYNETGNIVDNNNINMEQGEKE